MAKRSRAPRPGDTVAWKWGKGEGEGTVTAVHRDDVTTTIKGAKVTRHASPQKPAVDIKTSKGSKVLKSTTEIRKK